MMPAHSELETWVGTLKAQLEPASSNHIGFLVQTMANSMAMRQGQTSQMASRTDGWLLACGALPADLWTDGVTELLRTKTYMPSPGELMAIVGARFEERRRMLTRATGLLGGATKPKPPTPTGVPPQNRLRKILAEQLACTDIPEADRMFNTANTERALAFAERRPMEPWAAKFFEARAVGNVAAVTRAVMRDTTRTMERAAVEPWEPGEPLYQQHHEEPPPPTDIPEAPELEP